MEKPQHYITASLELHLFFARIMKEHAFFLKVGFLPPQANLAREAEQFLRRFEALLARAIALSNRVVRSRVLESGEVFTEFTARAEQQTQRYTGTMLDQSLTVRAMRLHGRDCADDFPVKPAHLRQVRQLNREALALVERLIAFKERLLDRVDCCEMFTVNYPLLIEHILREARLYRAYLMHLEGIGDCGESELRDSELFWNRIMMEHALFIRGLLDPTETELIDSADGFAEEYKRLLRASVKANDCVIEHNDALALTRDFRDFKHAGTEGIADCKIRSIILPLLADHVLREANHYLRLLEE